MRAKKALSILLCAAMAWPPMAPRVAQAAEQEDAAIVAQDAASAADDRTLSGATEQDVVDEAAADVTAAAQDQAASETSDGQALPEQGLAEVAAEQQTSDEQPAETDEATASDAPVNDGLAQDAEAVTAVATAEDASTSEAADQQGSADQAEARADAEQTAAAQEGQAEAEAVAQPNASDAATQEIAKKPTTTVTPKKTTSTKKTSTGASKSVAPKLTAAATTKVITAKGWNTDADGKKYYSWDGKTAAKGWQQIGGKWYYLDATTGVLKRNQAFVVAKKRYVANSSGACPANAWVKAAGAWYHTDASCAVQTGWFQSGGAWFYLDPKTGVMKESEPFQVAGVKYVANASGVCPSSGWVKVDGTWYYATSSCALRTGWFQSGGVWYYLNPSTGAMRCNQRFVVAKKAYVANASGACPANSWVKAAGKWYYTNASCQVRTGWLTLGGTQYYLTPKTGVMKASCSFAVGGVTYTADKNGACTVASSTWASTDLGWTYTDASGNLVKGWQSIDGIWYYFDKTTGRMMQGEVFMDGKTRYVARPDGSCPANTWVGINGKWYRTNGSCAVRTGWFDTGVSTFYLDPKDNGASATGTRTISGKKYFFYTPMGGLASYEYVTLEDGTRQYINGSGEFASSGPVYSGSGQSGWVWQNSGWYYIDAKTGKPKTGWIKDNGKRYWLDPEGVMVTGTQYIDGKGYWFSTSGDLVMTLTGTANDLIKAARADIGYSVDDDPQTGSKFGRWYQENCNPWKDSVDFGGDGVAYCVMAVSYWMNAAKVGAPGFPRAGCEGAALYARMESRAVAPSDISKGMLILFDWDDDGEPDHIGVVEKRLSDRTFQTIEGNTSLGTGGSQDNGGHVARRTRDIDSVYCGIKPYYM